MLIKHSLSSARELGINTPTLVEYYSSNQFDAETEYEIGILSTESLSQARILKGKEAGEYAERLKMYLGEEANVYFKKKEVGKLAYIVSIRTTNEVEITPEPTEEYSEFLYEVVEKLTMSAITREDYHLIFHYEEGESGNLILCEIKHAEL